MTSRYRLGVDIGGTFTDAVVVDELTGAMWTDKIPTTPGDPSDGFFQIFGRLMDSVPIRPGELSYVMHATTIATNAILERRGARVALLVTDGFRDVLEIARQVRHELYNLQIDKPTPLVPRRWCLEIPERIDHKGRILETLDEQRVASAAIQLRDEGVEAIAICFLHSYANPVHELRAAEIIREVDPRAFVVSSSSVVPEIREYWRASTTVINAYIAPLVSRYVGAIETRLSDAGVAGNLHIMESSGGILTSESAKERPVQLIESGPAAGVVGAAFVADLLDIEDVISFDMGGTTAKVGLILSGRPSVLTEWEVGSSSGSGPHLAKNSGYPVLGPVMDLVEIGAGGGSIAWVDSGGLLRVGPQSAGAVPGPACYGNGGTEPTVTDANLILGRLNADYFLGGEVRLRTDLARETLRSRCADILGVRVIDAAIGVIDIADAAMIQAIRLMSVARGHDPRGLSLVAFGGAGPLHANRLVADLGLRSAIIPPNAGVISALGMLTSDLRLDYRITRLQPLASADIESIGQTYRELETTALKTLSNQGVKRSKITLRRAIDMRYVGQSWKLTLDVTADALTKRRMPEMKDAFDQRHQEAYGYSVPDEPVEIVNLALTAVGLVPRPKMRRPGRGSSRPASRTHKGNRRVAFDAEGRFIDTPVYDRRQLKEGNVVPGPAVIEERDTATLVHPGYRAKVGIYGILSIEIV